MMSVKTYSKRKKPITSTRYGKKIIFLSCSIPDVCALSAVPASRFLRRVTLKGISQSCTKSTQRIFLSKVN